ncbi:hypothetical protein ACVWY3_003098 [Bradyrhizobium sp. USDA 4486]
MCVAWLRVSQRSCCKYVRNAFLQCWAFRSPVSRSRRRPDDADDVRFQKRDEHHEAQDFASEHGEAQSVFHVGSRSLDLGCTRHTCSGRLRLCTDCRCILISCCRSSGRNVCHCRERNAWAAPRGLGKDFRDEVRREARLSKVGHWRVSGVEHHPLRPFLVRSDAQVGPFARSDRGMRICRRRGEQPIGREQQHEEGASHPHEVLTYRHGKRSLSD